jgi:hypothetical protein
VTREEAVAAGSCAAAVEPADEPAVPEVAVPEPDVPVEVVVPFEAVVPAEDEETAAEPAGALVEEPLWAESSELQPLSAAMNEMHTIPAHALIAPTLYTIVTRSYCCVMSRKAGDQARPESRRQRMAAFGNPAICRLQTGSFAPPTCDGFALERDVVNHEKICASLCRRAQTNRPGALICFVN